MITSTWVYLLFMWCTFFFFQLIALLYFLKFVYLNWRLITLQYCSGFCHTLTWISHGCTCAPHPEPPPTSLSIPLCTFLMEPCPQRGRQKVPGPLPHPCTVSLWPIVLYTPGSSSLAWSPVSVVLVTHGLKMFFLPSCFCKEFSHLPFLLPLTPTEQK